MANYTTVSKVQAEFKSVTFATTTVPTLANVGDYLSDADAEIDCTLSVKYQTPITGTQALILIAMIEVWLVKDRILNVIKVKTGKNSEDQDGATNYRDKAMKVLNSLAAGTMKLTDATLVNSNDGVRSYTNENPTTAPRVFDRTINQW